MLVLLIGLLHIEKDVERTHACPGQSGLLPIDGNLCLSQALICKNYIHCSISLTAFLSSGFQFFISSGTPPV